MICSHAHRFIFIKTKKTASTAVELALGRHCGPGDVLTPIWADGREAPEGTLVRPGRNHRVPVGRLGLRGAASTLYRGARPALFANHEPAAEARRKIDPALWRSYFKFTLVRNPFDRVVSLYFWETRTLAPAERPAVFDWLSANAGLINETWRLIAEDGRLLVDEVVRHERLGPDLARIGERLGLPGLGEAVAARPMKTGQRPAGTDHRAVLDPRSRQLVELLCADEIEHFGYAF